MGYSISRIACKFENENKQVNFLDITITNTGNNSYDFKIFRKKLITNIQIKPNSNIAPHIAIGLFKGFLSLAYKICTEKHLQSKADFLIDTFTENGHNRNALTNIAQSTYETSINQKVTSRTTTRTR